MPLGLLLSLLPAGAQAHSFGQIYTLPLPIWLYLWGAAAALIASFVVVGFFMHEQAPPSKTRPAACHQHRLPPVLLGLLRALSAFSLLFCIATGLLGTPSPYGNFNMTFFWIIFVLGFGYVTALVGDVYALINPWRQLSRLIARIFPHYEQGRFRYPRACAYWPALALYMGFIWIELFSRSGPWALSMVLLSYTLINLLAVWLVGAKDWFEYGEFFSVYLRLIAKMAPVEFLVEPSGVVSPTFRFRWPFSGLLGEARVSVSLLVFVLFMLSSTAFDGLHETKPWVKLFWVDLYTHVLMPWVGSNPFAAYPVMNEIYRYWQSAWLVLLPAIYLLLYLAGITLMWWVTARRFTLRSLAMRFIMSLLPIVLVYHITHYYTLIQTQGIKIIALASDPFGRGHNWFGTADWFQGANIPDTQTVWHVQVALIVLGHVIGVWAAHVEALRCFGSRRVAVLSQIPMLALMVFFTTAGLWILAQPIQS